jgi:hypothetical protein
VGGVQEPFNHDSDKASSHPFRDEMKTWELHRKAVGVLVSNKKIEVSMFQSNASHRLSPISPPVLQPANSFLRLAGSQDYTDDMDEMLVAGAIQGVGHIAHTTCMPRTFSAVRKVLKKVQFAATI